MTSADAFLEARDFLVAHGDGYEVAYDRFTWPRLDTFNWALDFFDEQAKGNQDIALWVVEEDGTETKLTFADMAERSNRVANFLRGLGVKRGDRILIMLANVVPLWEVMLAAIKLGAVVIPATTLLAHDDLVDRIERGNVSHVVAAVQDTQKFEALPGEFTRTSVGGAAPGWSDYK
jgi:acetyl-CoA synthetase